MKIVDDSLPYTSGLWVYIPLYPDSLLLQLIIKAVQPDWYIGSFIPRGVMPFCQCRSSIISFVPELVLARYLLTIIALTGSRVQAELLSDSLRSFKGTGVRGSAPWS